MLVRMADESSDPSERDVAHEERHARAMDVYRTIRGDASVDPEQIARGAEAMLGALGTFTFDHVLGDIWSRPGLGRRDRSLVSVTALVCLGGEQELRTHIGGALNHGASCEELEEVMLQISGYAGFPRALEAMRTLMTVVQERDDVDRPLPRPAPERKNDERRRADGIEVFQRMANPSLAPELIPSMMEGQLGDLGRFGLHYLFGEVWARPQLSRRDRSLVTLVVLIVLGRFPELRAHVPGALNHGMTREEIDELILQLTLYAGYPAAVEAARMTREILQARDATDAGRGSPRNEK